jgi:hypothetical protein
VGPRGRGSARGWSRRARVVTSASGVVVGVTSLIAAFGLTWKGIGGSSGARRPRASRRSGMPSSTGQSRTAARPASMSSARPRDASKRLQEHSQIWRDWQRRWPDLDGDLGAARRVDRQRPNVAEDRNEWRECAPALMSGSALCGTLKRSVRALVSAATTSLLKKGSVAQDKEPPQLQDL